MHFEQERIARAQRAATWICFVAIMLVAIGTFAANWKLGCVVTGFTLFRVIRLLLGEARK